MTLLEAQEPAAACGRWVSGRRLRAVPWAGQRAVRSARAAGRSAPAAPGGSLRHQCWSKTVHRSSCCPFKPFSSCRDQLCKCSVCDGFPPLQLTSFCVFVYFGSVALIYTLKFIVSPDKNGQFLSIGSIFCENRSNFNLKIQMSLTVTMVICDHGNRVSILKSTQVRGFS